MSRTEEMRRVLRRWERSELTMKAFAESEGIPYSTFIYWKRRLSSVPRLVPVQIVDDERAVDDDGELELGEPIVISTRSGLVVRVPRDIEEHALARLVGVLARC